MLPTRVHVHKIYKKPHGQVVPTKPLKNVTKSDLAEEGACIALSTSILKRSADIDKLSRSMSATPLVAPTLTDGAVDFDAKHLIQRTDARQGRSVFVQECHRFSSQSLCSTLKKQLRGILSRLVRVLRLQVWVEA